MKRLNKGLALFFSAAIVLTLDQITKFLIRANMSPGQSIPEEGFFRITYFQNEGGAFGIGDALGIMGNQAFLISLTVIAIIAIIVLYSRYPLFNQTLVRIALGLLLGGAIGNLIDRLWLGFVVDFIDVGAWPVFNLADSAITVSVILIIYYLLFPARRAVSRAKNGQD